MSRVVPDPRIVQLYLCINCRMLWLEGEHMAPMGKGMGVLSEERYIGHCPRCQSDQSQILFFVPLRRLRRLVSLFGGGDARRSLR
jgi:hypothetical protein